MFYLSFHFIIITIIYLFIKYIKKIIKMYAPGGGRTRDLRVA